MALCTYCARLINENCFDPNDQTTVQHHPNIYSFEESAQSCELCQYFVQLCGPGRIQRVKKDADAGLWNRTLIRSHTRRAPNCAVRTATIRQFMVASAKSEFTSRSFALATSLGWSHLSTRSTFLQLPNILGRNIGQ
jgi:hypothetical protein